MSSSDSHHPTVSKPSMAAVCWPAVSWCVSGVGSG